MHDSAPHPVLLPMKEGTLEHGAERATTFPLPPHPLADAVVLSCTPAKASLLGERQGEGRVAEFFTESGAIRPGAFHTRHEPRGDK